MADKVENKLVGIETLKSFTTPEELEAQIKTQYKGITLSLHSIFNLYE